MLSPISTGTEIRVILCLPQPDDQPPLAIPVKAIVKRCNLEPGGKHQVGAEFLRETAKAS